MKALLFPFSPTEPSVQLTRDFPELDWTVVQSPEDVARAAPGAAIYVTSNRTCKAETGEALRRHGQALRWMHFTSAGIDNGIAMGIPDGVIVTNSAGVRAGNVSEHALTLLLALVRKLPNLMACQRAHEWRRVEMTPHISSLEGATVCVVGRGPIGRELARKLAAINARPIAVSRTPDSDGDVEQVFPRERLHDALAISDAIAICTAGDETTRHMIGAAEFAAMKRSAPSQRSRDSGAYIGRLMPGPANSSTSAPARFVRSPRAVEAASTRPGHRTDAISPSPATAEEPGR